MTYREMHEIIEKLKEHEKYKVKTTRQVLKELLEALSEFYDEEAKDQEEIY